MSAKTNGLQWIAAMIALPLTLFATPLLSQENPLVGALLNDAAEACGSYEDGTFEPGDGVSTLTLEPDGTEVILIDEGRFSCSTAVSMYCGSGGCVLHAVIGEYVASWQATGWRTVDWNGDTILLIGRDGGWCGGIGAEWCYEAVNWLNGRFMTVMPPRQ